MKELTQLTGEEWRTLARRYPELGRDPGRRAALARCRLHYLIGRALSTPRHGPRWDGAVPTPPPALYLTAHFGDLRAIRYFLRREGVAAAHLLGPENMSREAIAREDERFDRRHPIDFPHVVASDRPHAAARLLSRGSLIVAVDRPPGEGRDFPLLGGTVALDPRPLRLARIAGTPLRAVFLSAPSLRLTLTVEEIPEADSESALARFAEIYRRVASRSPWELDGYSYRRPPARPSGS